MAWHVGTKKSLVILLSKWQLLFGTEVEFIEQVKDYRQYTDVSL
jgi:hypothetical protein